MRKNHLLACAILLCLTGCQANDRSAADGASSSRDVANAGESIRLEEKRALANWNTRDATKVIGNYARDATVMLPGLSIMAGHNQIRPVIEGALQDPNFTLIFNAQKVDVARSGDLAYSRGTYTQTFSDPTSKRKVTQSGNYLTVFRKQKDGSWKAIEDIATPGPSAGPGVSQAGRINRSSPRIGPGDAAGS